MHDLYFLSTLLNTSLNNFLSETNIKDVLKAISDIYFGRLVSYKQIKLHKNRKCNLLNIYVCIQRLTKMIYLSLFTLS